MKKVTIKLADRNEIDWVNSKYDEVNFKKSDFENEHIIIAKVDGENAGLGRLVKIDNDNLELGGIYAFPNFRGMRVADSIVRSLCEENPFNESTIWCLPFENLLSFYSKFGFESCEGHNAPDEIVQKLSWCNSENRYEKQVLLLCKKNRKPVYSHA